MDLGRRLIDELAIAPPACIALVGAGGKTTLMRALYAEGRRRGWSVLAGTTTKVGRAQVADIEGFVHAGAEGDKLTGVAPGSPALLGADLVVVEADGARSMVVKAPAAYEPVLPDGVTHVVAVIGADALDRVIEDVAHRPMLVAAVCGCGPYARLTVDRAAVLLASERGGRKAVPAGAAFAVAITRVGPAQLQLAQRLAAALAEAGVPTLVLPLVLPLVQRPPTTM
ncbi:MAG: selenium cofactor biosynthesis protein YqeC [Actinomycetota bacterium]|nr:selenium cofactor biosynthesis protein YqeC [Actinomycetota bacterium]